MAMTTPLHLTPTRRALLEAAHEERVIQGIVDSHTWLVEPGYPNRKVNDRVLEAEREGWLRLDEAGVFWQLTAGGREALGWSQ